MKKTLCRVYLSLLILLALTVGTSYLKLGAWNEILNISIAVIKALLVLLFFMQVRLVKKPTLIFVVAGFVWLALLVSLTLSDYLTRGMFLILGK